MDLVFEAVMQGKPLETQSDIQTINFAALFDHHKKLCDYVTFEIQIIIPTAQPPLTTQQSRNMFPLF